MEHCSQSVSPGSSCIITLSTHAETEAIDTAVAKMVLSNMIDCPVGQSGRDREIEQFCPSKHPVVAESHVASSQQRNGAQVSLAQWLERME
jgi:hypothetical protein